MTMAAAVSDRLTDLAERFVAGGDLPECCAAWQRALSPERDAAAAYRDPAFEAAALAVQVDPSTDDGSRRATLREAELRFLLGSRSAGAVLDLMCGSGAYLSSMERMAVGVRSYLGVDVSTRAIRDAAQLEGPGRQFVVADVRDHALPATYDTVLLTYEAVNHFGADDAKRVLTRAARALADDGLLFVDVQLAEHRRVAYGRTASVQVDGTALSRRPHVVAVHQAREVQGALVHVITADGTCCLHFRSCQWFPSWSWLCGVLAELGLCMARKAQLHLRVQTDKPAIRTATQIVVERKKWGTVSACS